MQQSQPERMLARWSTVSLTLLVVAGAAVHPARADEPAQSLSGEVAELYRRGRTLYKKGDYSASARKLREAHEKFPHPLLLYNLALAEWRSGSYHRALDAARKTDRKGISEKLRPKNSGMIRALEARQRAAEIAITVQRRRAARPPQRDRTPPRPRSDRRGLGAMGWTGIAVGSFGVLSLGGALWIDRRLERLEEEFRRARRSPNRQRYRDLQSQIVLEQTIGRVMLGVGVATAGTGIYLLARDLVARPNGRAGRRRGEEFPAFNSLPRLTVAPQPRGVVVRITWR